MDEATDWVNQKLWVRPQLRTAAAYVYLMFQTSPIQLWELRESAFA
jgi:hypothetical protein